MNNSPETGIDSTSTPIPLGIGACLLGNAVRYDGSAKRLSGKLQQVCEHFEIQSFCPEVAIGLGTPRDPIHLVNTGDAIRVLDVATHSKDYTEPLKAYAAQVMQQAPKLCGYILVKGSPSCGHRNVKRFSIKGTLQAEDQDGIFAAALNALDPNLPIEDDEKLNESRYLENFIIRVQVYHRWKQLTLNPLTPTSLLEFYSRHKYLLMAHSPPTYQKIGRLLADLKSQPLENTAQQMIVELMRALGKPACRAGYTNALQHIAGYLKRSLTAPERRRLHEHIQRYQSGEETLADVRDLLHQHFALHPNAYIAQQVLLHPSEVLLLAEKLSLQGTK